MASTSLEIHLIVGKLQNNNKTILENVTTTVLFLVIFFDIEDESTQGLCMTLLHQSLSIIGANKSLNILETSTSIIIFSHIAYSLFNNNGQCFNNVTCKFQGYRKYKLSIPLFDIIWS